MLAVVVVAPVPFVTTHTAWLAEGVNDLTLGAEPVVEPDILQSKRVDAPVIEVLPKVNVKSAAAAIETPVKVTEPARPLQLTVPEAAPLPVVTGSTTPDAAATATKLPLVAVIAPDVAVTVVPAVTDPAVTPKLPVVTVNPVPAVIVVVEANEVVVSKDPGAVMADGKLHVIVLPEPTVVIWFAVPNKLIFPAVGLIAPPLPPVKVATAPVPPPRIAHVAVPPESDANP